MKLLKITLLFFISVATMMHSSAKENKSAYTSQPDKEYPYVALSKDLVKAAKNNSSYEDIKQKLANVPPETLARELDTDAAKKAFWINVYNAYVQLILSENPELFKDRGSFFGDDKITIAGKKLSFDDIEHGMIRGSQVKWLLGFVQDPFAGDYEEALRVKNTDGRIHFALNCGAISCPEVAIYDAKVIDQQLDIAAKQYLQKSSTYKPEENKVYVTSLFSWFRGDFGGKDGIVEFLKKYEVIPQDANPDLEFKDYDWTLDLGNYKEINVASTSKN